MTREHLTACLIVQDEEELLPEALDSVAFCDEIVVVDGGSTDRTVGLARHAGARVVENPWPGFAIQRNLALDAAATEWILEIDADERISPRLRASIEAFLAAPQSEAGICVCALRQHFLGRALGPSAKYPAYRSRLFRRGAYRHDEHRTVHEGVYPHERPAVLDGDLEHELATTLNEALADTWRYARLESFNVAKPATRRAYLTGIVLRPAGKLVYRTLVDGGWRDGWRGLLKLSLDVISDSLVWIFVLRRRREDATAPSDDTSREHFGRRAKGPAKIVAVAGRHQAAQTAADWLTQMQAYELDVALISDLSAQAGAVPVQAVRRLRPLPVMRALDIEMQLRTIDAVVPVGRRARLVLRLVPRNLRPAIPGVSAESDPGRAAELAHTKSSRRPDKRQRGRDRLSAT